jgi:hypothetical protein
MSATKAYRIRWTEHERGWGSRPDGVTLHRDEAEARRFIANYWASQPDKINGRAPDEYSAPGEPELTDVSPAEAERLKGEGSYWLKVSGW